MFRICLSCHRPFPGNETLEHLPVGKRVAYDPERGRLWAICTGCGRWTLAPIEERWEALEELERAVTDRARLLSQTDHIALLRYGDIDIVRVGRAALREEAWWRYGREFLRRRKQHQALAAAGIGTAVAVMFGAGAAGIGIGGFGWGLWQVGQRFPEVGRWWRYGRTAWRGYAMCERCGSALNEVRFRDRGRFSIIAGDEGGADIAGDDDGDGAPANVQLVFRCWRCGAREEAGYRLTGAAARHVARRVLAYENYAGAEEKDVADATRLIADAGSAAGLTASLTAGSARGSRLGDLKRVPRLALEIAVNEENERQALELELARLEERWREEEELAAIIDGELTPVESFRRLLQEVRGGRGET